MTFAIIYAVCCTVGIAYMWWSTGRLLADVRRRKAARREAARREAARREADSEGAYPAE